MVEFNKVSTESYFIKNLLYSTFLPLLRTVKENDYIIRDRLYIYKCNIIRCTSSGYIPAKNVNMNPDEFPKHLLRRSDDEKVLPGQIYYIIRDKKITRVIGSPNDMRCPRTEGWYEQNIATYETLGEYYFGERNDKFCRNFLSSSEGYDYKTHEKLGHYLRSLRDMYGLNLMPLYNCFSNQLLRNIHITNDKVSKTSEDFNTKVYKVPIRFNTDYTICMENVGLTTFAPAFIHHGTLMNLSNNRFGNNVDATNKYIKLNHNDVIHNYPNLRFKDPIKLRFDNVPLNKTKSYSKYVYTEICANTDPKYYRLNPEADHIYEKRATDKSYQTIDYNNPELIGEKIYQPGFEFLLYTDEGTLFADDDVFVSDDLFIPIPEGEFYESVNPSIGTFDIITKTYKKCPEDEVFFNEKIFNNNKTKYYTVSNIVTPGETVTNTGDVVSFNSTTNETCEKLVASIEPIQDLNGYDAPWVGGAGVNKWDDEWEVGSININTGQNAWGSDTVRSKNYIPVIAESSYYLLCSLGGVRFYYYDSTQAFISTGVVTGNRVTTIPTGVSYIRFRVGSANDPVTSLTAGDIAINYPSTVTTYSPWQNICPISGRNSVEVVDCGKNLWSPKNYDGGIYNPTIGSTWTLTESATQFTKNGNEYSVSTSATWKCFTLLFEIKDENKSYYRKAVFASTGTGGTSEVYLDKDFKVLSSFNSTDATQNKAGVLSIPNGAKYYALLITNRGTANTTLTLTAPQIEISATATTFETYNGTTRTIALGTTVYGGTLDLVSGELTVTHLFFEENTADMNNNENYPGWLGHPELYNVVAQGSQAALDDLMGNIGEYASFNNIGSGLLYLPTNRYGGLTQSEWKAMAVDVQFVLPLLTPQTYQLTPQQIQTLLGVNNIWADSGDIEITHTPYTNNIIYVQCTQSSVYDPDEIYYYVDKDKSDTWYEFINDEFVPTQDTYIVPDKIYYKKEMTEVPITLNYDITEENCCMYDYIEDELYLLIQVPAALDTNIVILEGDYTDIEGVKIFDQEKFELFSNEKLDKLFTKNLILMETATKKIRPFSPTLIQFLLWNAICNLDTINNDLDRLYLILDEVAAGDLPSEYNHNYWYNKYRELVFEYADTFPREYIRDNLGYVTTSIEKILYRGRHYAPYLYEAEPAAEDFADEE